MRNNWVREKLNSGQATVGCFVGLGSPNAIELLAHAGYDWLVIETEHNALDSAQVQQMLMAMNGTEAIPIVRLPSSRQDYIQKALDIGGLGILVPMVKSAAEAQAIVDATRFPPEGKRGFGPLRASHYTLDYEDYFRRANDNIVVALMLETKEAVDDLEAIMAVPGVDAVYVGWFDMCLSLGLDPMKQSSYPEVEAIFDRTLALGKEHSVAVGYGASTPEELRQLQARGFRFIVYGTDYKLLLNAALAGLEVFKRDLV